MAKLGRPSEYIPEYCDKIVEFFNVPITIATPEDIVSKGEVLTIVKEKATPLPTFERFCSSIGISIQTMHDWCKKHPEFLDAYRQAKILQKDHLIQNGLNGNFNAAFAKFVAINCTNMVDKVEVKHSGNTNSDVAKLSDKELLDRIEEAKKE